MSSITKEEGPQLRVHLGTDVFLLESLEATVP